MCIVNYPKYRVVKYKLDNLRFKIEDNNKNKYTMNNENFYIKFISYVNISPLNCVYLYGCLKVCVL